MSKITMLRLLITKRLTAAAEEIFSVFGQTIAELEDEISRVRFENAQSRRRAELSARPRVVLRGGGELSVGGVGGTGGLSDQTFNSCGSTDSLNVDADIDAALKEEAEFLQIKEEEGEGDHNSLGEEKREDVPPNPEQQLGLFHGLTVTNTGDQLTVPELRLQPETSTRPSQRDSDDTIKHGTPQAALDSYVCTVCGRVFANRAHWTKHVQAHRKSHGDSEKSYTCDICGKKLTRLDGYQKHRRVHTGEKPYTCGQCGRSFSDNSNYKRHVRTHAAQSTGQS